MAESKRHTAPFGIDDEATLLAQIASADRRPTSSEPQAEAVRYDAATRRVELSFRGGLTVGFDVDSVPELAEATDVELARLNLSPAGSFVSLAARDVDLAVDGLLLDLLGAAGWKNAIRSQLNREAARVKSAPRANAARENGKKGGRPKAASARKASSAVTEPTPQARATRG